MRAAIQIFSVIFATTAFCLQPATLKVGSRYAIKFADIDGRRLATDDGHVVLLAVINREDEAKAQQLGDSVPRRFIGNPNYRAVNVVHLDDVISNSLRPVTSMLLRRHRETHIADMRKVYQSRHLKTDPADDIFAVGDFDGAISRQLNLSDNQFAVFVFGRNGRLFGNWNEIPSVESLSAAMTAAGAAN